MPLSVRLEGVVAAGGGLCPCQSWPHVGGDGRCVRMHGRRVVHELNVRCRVCPARLSEVGTVRVVLAVPWFPSREAAQARA